MIQISHCILKGEITLNQSFLGSHPSVIFSLTFLLTLLAPTLRCTQGLEHRTQGLEHRTQVLEDHIQGLEDRTLDLGECTQGLEDLILDSLMPAGLPCLPCLL